MKEREGEGGVKKRGKRQIFQWGARKQSLPIRTGIRWLLAAESLCAVGYVPKYYIDFRQQVSGLSDLMKVDPPRHPPFITGLQRLKWPKMGKSPFPKKHLKIINDFHRECHPWAY